MNRRQALMNALAAVSYRKTEAVNQQHLARDLNNDDLAAFWQKEADEAEQTYRELLAILGECNEPQASPANSPDRTGDDGGHHPAQPGTGHEPGRPAQAGDGDDHEGQAPDRHGGGAARAAEVAAGNVPGDEAHTVSIATSCGGTHVQP